MRSSQLFMLLGLGLAIAKQCCWQVISTDATQSLSWKWIGLDSSSDPLLTLAIPKVVSQGGSFLHQMVYRQQDKLSGEANVTRTFLYNVALNISFRIQTFSYFNGTNVTVCLGMGQGQAWFPTDGVCFGNSARPGSHDDLPIVDGTVRYAGYEFTRYRSTLPQFGQTMDVSDSCIALVLNNADTYDPINPPITVGEYQTGPTLPTSYFDPPSECHKSTSVPMTDSTGMPKAARAHMPFFLRAASPWVEPRF